MKLSKDYSAWGDYSMQILYITLILIIGSGIPFYLGLIWKSLILLYFGTGTVILAFAILAYGMYKQDKELKKKWSL